MRLERDKEVLGRAPSPSFLHAGVLCYRTGCATCAGAHTLAWQEGLSMHCQSS